MNTDEDQADDLWAQSAYRRKKMTGRSNTKAPSSRKGSRIKTKGGKELLKCKEKYGKEHKNICDLFLKGQPHHKLHQQVFLDDW